MARVVSTGAQDFEKIRKNNCFYVDKTNFIKEWWESMDDVTLIARPRRFGKTLNMSMLERFFSIKYAGDGEVFEGLSIWEDEKYRAIQGTYPVINLSFACVKANNFKGAIEQIFFLISDLYSQNYFLLDRSRLLEKDKAYFERIDTGMTDSEAAMSLNRLSGYLYRYYGKKVIILLDEYDTPMQEAYLNGYWEELVSFMRNFFNATFKTNPYLERSVMTGITRVSKESIFSDLNNLNVVTTTSEMYASCFGFTEAEVFAAMDEFGLANKDEVKAWYDGFTFGSLTDIYNPWSITNFLKQKKLAPYWADTSSNGLVGSLIQTGNSDIKEQFEQLLRGETITAEIDEQIVFSQLERKRNAVWSLLLASGYLKTMGIQGKIYGLALTNYEVKQMFEGMVEDWFAPVEDYYNDFIKALLKGNLKAMNRYMGSVALSMFSSFDGGSRPSKEADPERFYHGFVLGLLVDLKGRYSVTSNRESGFGRYDVMLEPLNKDDDGIILEFKVHDPEDEKNLQETVQSALKQIEEKRYEQTLLDHGVPSGKIRRYGFAFEGKKVLIGE